MYICIHIKLKALENAKQWCLSHLNARAEVKNEQKKSPKICRKYIEDIQGFWSEYAFYFIE